MAKKILVAAMMLMLVVSVVVAKNGASSGEETDPNAPALGVIKYLGNNAGYHFWFTPTSDIGPYTAGQSYHNVYKYEVDDPGEWMGPVTIPNRPPYNLAGEAGKQVYYKIIPVGGGK